MRIVFCGFPVYASALVNGTTYKFWLHPNSNDVKWQVEVDMAENSALALAGKLGWGKVKVDAGEEHSGTRLFGWRQDRAFGEVRAFTGVLYLEKTFAEGRGLTPPVSPDLHTRSGSPLGMPYEFETALYTKDHGDSRAGRRYYGFHAQIAETRGKKALVLMYHAGTSQEENSTPAATRWIELNDAANHGYDLEAPNGLTQLVKNPKGGALFIEREQARDYLKLKLQIPGNVLGKRPGDAGFNDGTEVS